MSAIPSLSWSEGKLTIAKDCTIGQDRCVICGAQPVLHWSQKFVWTPPWTVIVLFLGGPCLYVIVALIFQKRAKPTFAICQPCKKAWSWSKTKISLIGIGGLFAIPGLFCALGSMIAADFAVFAGVLGVLVWLGLLVYQTRSVKPKAQIVSTRIDAQMITLQFPNWRVSKEVLESSTYEDIFR